MGGMGDSGPTVFDPPRAILCRGARLSSDIALVTNTKTQTIMNLKYDTSQLDQQVQENIQKYVKLGMAFANMTIPRSYNPLPLSFFSRLTRQGEQLHFRNNRKQEGVAVSHTHILERCLNMWSRAMRVWMGAMCNRYIQSQITEECVCNSSWRFPAQ